MKALMRGTVVVVLLLSASGAAGQTSTLRIESTPPGARVFIRTGGHNGFPTVGKTPLALKDHAHRHLSKTHLRSASKEPHKTGRRTWSFETDAPGTLPNGWKAATPAATWRVIEDKTAPSGKHVLALVAHKRKSNSVRDCCWTDDVSFLDGVISVRFKAVRGDIEKGGGLAWRVQNGSTYYNVRTNYGPRGNNVGLYCMVKWRRVWKVYAKNVRLSVGEWHTMTVAHRGDNIKVTVNGRKLLDVTHKNSPLASPGGVGVCTKGDAITSFDDLTVTPAVSNAEASK